MNYTEIVHSAKNTMQMLTFMVIGMVRALTFSCLLVSELRYNTNIIEGSS